MRKGYHLIFDTYLSDTECKQVLEDALGEISDRSSRGRLIKIDPIEIDTILENQNGNTKKKG